MFITVTHCTTTNKESACRIICMVCQQTSPKYWFANVNTTSYRDVTNSVYPVTMTTIRHCSILEFGRGASNQAVALGITRPLHAGFNTSKTKVLTISSNITHHSPLQLANHLLSKVDFHKHLGLIFHRFLSWHTVVCLRGGERGTCLGPPPCGVTRVNFPYL